MKNKLLKLSVFLILGFFVVILNPVSAQITPIPTYIPKDTSASEACYDPTSQTFNTKSCIEERLGLTSIDASTVIIKRDPNSLIVVGFRFFLYIVIVITVARIVLVGFKIGGTKDDADKRKELFQELVWIVVGLIIALGALSITFAVQYWFFGKNFYDQAVDCESLDSLPKTEQTTDLQNLCDIYLNDGSNSNSDVYRGSGGNKSQLK